MTTATPPAQRSRQQPSGPPRQVSAPPPGRPDAAIPAAVLTVLAILAGASALGVVVSGTSWILPLTEVVVVVAAVGIACRLVRVPLPVTVLIQLVALAIVLTSLFTTSGIAGVIPDASAVREAKVLLSGAWQQVLTTVPPAPASPELTFLICLSVGMAALVSDVLAAGAKAPALVGLPLLCLYSVPAAIATDLLPWYTFVAPALLYALLLATAGHPGRRAGLRTTGGMIAGGGAIAAVSLVVALLVAGSMTWVGTAGRLPRNEASSGDIGLSPFTTLSGDLKRSQAIDVLRVTGMHDADYLRTVALQKWVPNKGFEPVSLPSGGASVNGPLPGEQTSIDDEVITVTSLSFRDKYLPIPAHTTSVTGLGPSWMFSSALQTVYRSDPLNPGTYQLTQRQTKPTEDELRRDSVTPGGPLTETGSLRAEVRDTAQQVTEGATTAYDKAAALLRWFTDPDNGFRYSTQVPTGNSGDRLVDFLQNKQGYCEQYATAMAVMLRSLGIPAQVAIGFTQGRPQPDGSRIISSHDAHAWVEVPFDKAGWVRFDPTPLVNGQGGLQGFVDSPDSGPTTSTGQSTTASQPTVTVPPKSNVPDGGEQSSTQVAGSVQAADGGGGSGGLPTGLIKAVLWTMVVVVLLALLVFAPTWVRALRRRRRLARAASADPDAPLFAWSELEDLAVDHGVGLHPAESARVAANRIARRAQLEDPDRARLRQLVVAAEQCWYASLPASGPVAGAPTMGVDYVSVIKAVRTGLAFHEPTDLLDRWLPRSLRRS